MNGSLLMNSNDDSDGRLEHRRRTLLPGLLMLGGVLVLVAVVLWPTRPGSTDTPKQGTGVARVEELRRADRTSAEAIIAELSKLDRPELRELAKFIKDDNPNVQRGVAIAMAQAPSLDVETAKELQAGLRDPAVTVRENCAKAVGRSEWKGPEVAALMAAMFADQSRDVRGIAASALGEQREAARPHIPALSKLMKEDWWGSGPAAAVACRKLGKIAIGAEPSLRSLLIQRMGWMDKDEAIEALGEIRTPQALNVLIDQVRDTLGPPSSRNSDKVERACRAIAKFGPEGRPALYVLKRVYETGKRSAAPDPDYDSACGMAAREAILAIDPAEAKALGIKPK